MLFFEKVLTFNGQGGLQPSVYAGFNALGKKIRTGHKLPIALLDVLIGPEMFPWKLKFIPCRQRVLASANVQAG